MSASGSDPQGHLGKIEAELRRLGVLEGPLEAAHVVHSAFGTAEMPFEHWLVKVFLPRAYEVAETGEWPSQSQVGLAALREFDGRHEYEPLVSLLFEFDEIAVAHSRRSGA